jgi:hypothetical protein
MPTYTITFTHDEVQQVGAFIDLALKHAGAQVLKPAYAIVAKLEAADPDETPIVEIPNG